MQQSLQALPRSRVCLNSVTLARVAAPAREGEDPVNQTRSYEFWCLWNDVEHYDTLCTKKALTHSKNITLQPKLLARWSCPLA